MITVRRTVSMALLIAALLVAAVPAPVAAAMLSIGEARSYMLNLINTKRANNGVSAVTVDSRVQDVAQARSDDMATNHYFGHLSNAELAAMFNKRGVAWSKLGEILAKNSWPPLGDSADAAMNGWRNSSSHWNIIVDPAYNLVGVGVAKDTASGHWIWTVEFVKGSAGTALVLPSVVYTKQEAAGVNATYGNAVVSWSGDRGTHAIKNFKVQYRINSGTWRTLYRTTTRTSATVTVRHGRKVEFRVRARDTRGNLGSWARSIVIEP